MAFILQSYIKIEIFNPVFLLLLLSLCSVLSTEQPILLFVFAIPVWLFLQRLMEIKMLIPTGETRVPHFSFRDCGIQEVNSGQGFDPHNHTLNLTPTTGDESRLLKGNMIAPFQNLKRNVMKRGTRIVFICFGCSHISY